MGAFHFQFERHVPLDAAEMSLHLAMFAVEGLVGRARVRLAVKYVLDEGAHCIDINGGDRVCRMVVRVFAGLLLREFGEESFQVQHVEDDQHQPAGAAA